MSDAAALDALRREIEALRDIVQPRRKKYPTRRVVTVPVTLDEQAAIRAAADARGVCVADLLRIALQPVLQQEMRINRDNPAGLRGHNRRKPDRFDDGRSDARELDRVRLARQAQSGIIAAKTLARDHSAASFARAAPDTGMLSETAGAAVFKKTG